MQKLITHPHSGETLNQRQWAQRLGICTQAMSARLQKLPLEKALTVGRISNEKAWSGDEEEYLAQVYRTPNLLRLWNQAARKRGWSPRTQTSLNDRIAILKSQGLLTDRRQLDPRNGWLTENQLADCLGVDRQVIDRWVRNHALPAYGDRTYSIKVHLQHFTNWATSSTNSGLVAKAVNSNSLAINWLLVQMRNWLGEDPPDLGSGSKSISRRSKSRAL